MNLDQISISKIETFIEKSVANEPIIEITPNWFRIRNIFIKQRFHKWEVCHNKKVTIFSYKTWAVAYAMSICNNNYRLSEFLCKVEKRLIKLKVDQLLYKFHQSKTNDKNKYEILQQRLDQTQYALEELHLDTRQMLLYQSIG